MKRGQVLEISGSKAVVQVFRQAEAVISFTVNSVICTMLCTRSWIVLAFLSQIMASTHALTKTAIGTDWAERSHLAQVFEGTSGIDNKNTQVPSPIPHASRYPALYHGFTAALYPRSPIGLLPFAVAAVPCARCSRC